MSAGQSFDLLIIDDDAIQVDLVRMMMRELKLSHVCHHAASGLAALDFLNRRPPFENAPRPHLILLDLNMPRMNGCELLRLLKADEQFRSIPVVMFSNSDDLRDIEACYGEHANAYIRKPTDLNSNLSVLTELDRFWFGTARLRD